MGRHRVLKRFRFCYGHRLLEHAGRCRNLHGHNAEVEVVCEGPLDDGGMVVDFADVDRILGAWVDEHWDHKMILWERDPLVQVLRDQDQPVFELGGHPTAENLAAHLWDVGRDLGLPVVSVRLWEGTDSCASFDEP